MQTSEHPSKGRLIGGVALSVLGKLGLVISSFNILSAVVFFWQTDHFRLLRVCIILAVSVLMMIFGASLLRDRNWRRAFIRSLPLVISAFGCLGVVSTVSDIYLHRQPHAATTYEAGWFWGCLAGFAVCIFIFRRHKKHAKHAA
jgi:uncharacterized membrane protein YfcA